MKFIETKLSGSFIIELEKRVDERGFFARNFCEKEFAEHGLETRFVQANTSFNHRRGTLRGMHYQLAPYQEVKLVRCTRGTVYNVIIDLRTESPTYKQWIGVELTQENHRAIYAPKDFANGYLTLTDESEVMYLVTQFYQPDWEVGVRWNDQAFKIDWLHQVRPELMSHKDRSWPDYKG